MKFENYMILEFPSKSCKQKNTSAFRRMCFCKLR